MDAGWAKVHTLNFKGRGLSREEKRPPCLIPEPWDGRSSQGSTGLGQLHARHAHIQRPRPSQWKVASSSCSLLDPRPASMGSGSSTKPTPSGLRSAARRQEKARLMKWPCVQAGWALLPPDVNMREPPPQRPRAMLMCAGDRGPGPRACMPETEA